MPPTGLFHQAYKPTSLQGQGEQCKADRAPIRARPPETAHDRRTAGYVGNLVDTRAASSSTGIFASPCAISGKMLYERGPAPQKLRLRRGPLHPCVQCCPDILCRDLSTMPCGSLPARPPGACIPLQLGLSAYLLWWQCMLAVPGCMCCLLCMPASQCTVSDMWASCPMQASHNALGFGDLVLSTIIGFSHTSTPSSIF